MISYSFYSNGSDMCPLSEILRSKIWIAEFEYLRSHLQLIRENRV
jgi:hypothetical protein